MRKILSLVLALAMLLGMCSFAVSTRVAWGVI